MWYSPSNTAPLGVVFYYSYCNVSKNWQARSRRVGSRAWEAICYLFGCLLSKERWQEVHERLKSFEVFQSSSAIPVSYLGLGQGNGSVLFAFLGFISRFKQSLTIIEGQAMVREC